jgi:hypothetical protein
MRVGHSVTSDVIASSCTIDLALGSPIALESTTAGVSAEFEVAAVGSIVTCGSYRP